MVVYFARGFLLRHRKHELFKEGYILKPNQSDIILVAKETRATYVKISTTTFSQPKYKQPPFKLKRLRDLRLFLLTMTMNKILLLLIVASGFLLIFYANNDIFTRRRWINIFHPADEQQHPQSDDTAAAEHLQQQQHRHSYADAPPPISPALNHHVHMMNHQPHKSAAAAESTAELKAIRYTPKAASNNTADSEHNIFVIYTKENYLLKTKFELFMKSLLKYATVPLHLHIITDARSKPAAEEIMRTQIGFYKHQPIAGRVQYSLYNVTESAGKITDITAAMMPHFTVVGSHYADALFYVSLGLHRIVDPRMRRAILIDCDVVFRSDVRGLFEEFDK